MSHFTHKQADMVKDEPFSSNNKSSKVIFLKHLGENTDNLYKWRCNYCIKLKTCGKSRSCFAPVLHTVHTATCFKAPYTSTPHCSHTATCFIAPRTSTPHSSHSYLFQSSLHQYSTLFTHSYLFPSSTHQYSIQFTLLLVSYLLAPVLYTVHTATCFIAPRTSTPYSSHSYLFHTSSHQYSTQFTQLLVS